mmetsp:Transcript_3518/g.5749  ORF Transcript_3518/g.5749 Transcript_3518/m.5749 type:complete len:213 (+) Transcript_3518:95-733(+)
MQSEAKFQASSSTIHVGTVVMFIIQLDSLSSSDNVLFALIDDFFDVCDPLSVPVILPLGVLIDEGFQPTVHLVLHVILLVLDQRHVCLVEVGTILMHLLTVAEKPSFVCVIVSKRHLLILCERVHLAVSTLCKVLIEVLLKVLKLCKEVIPFLHHRLHNHRDPRVEIRNCFFDALLELDLVGHELISQTIELLQQRIQKHIYFWQHLPLLFV